MIPTRNHCSELGALTPSGFHTSHSWVSHYLQEKMPAPECSYHSEGDLPAHRGVSTAQQSCPMLLVTTWALPCLLSAVISQNTSPHKPPAAPQAELQQEDKEAQSVLNKTAGEQNGRKLCWCFSAALGFPSPASL